MPRTNTRDKFWTAISDSYDAFLSAIEATESRNHGVSRAVLSQARKGEKDLVALARQWSEAPTDFFANLEAAVDAQARAQKRAIEFTRESVAGADEYRREVQQAFGKVIEANRAFGGVLVEAARETYGQLIGRVFGAAGESTNGAARPARKPSAASARSRESAERTAA